MHFKIFFIFFPLLLSLSGKSQIDQAFINENLKVHDQSKKYIKTEKLKNGFEILFFERHYDCFGDDCLEINFGLSNDSLILNAVFDELKLLKSGVFYLQKGDSTAIMDVYFKIINQKSDLILLDGDYLAFKENDFWGILNSDLTVQIAPKYDAIQEVFDWSDFSGGDDIFNSYKYYFTAKSKGKWAILDLNDSLIFDFNFDKIFPQFNGAIVSIGQKQGYIDQYNRIHVPIAFDSVIWGFVNCVVIKDNKMALHGMFSDSLITSFIYTEYTDQSPYNCRCMKGPRGWEILNGRGERIGDYYDAIKNYTTDVVPVMKNNKWGFVDCRSQKILEEPKYDRILRFFGHEAIVMYKGEDMKVSFED